MVLGLENFERDGWMDGLGGNVGKKQIISFPFFFVLCFTSLLNGTYDFLFFFVFTCVFFRI